MAEDGVQLHQYVPTELTVENGSGWVTLEVATEYPREGRVTVTEMRVWIPTS
jgi:DUF1680 family protein